MSKKIKVSAEMEIERNGNSLTCPIEGTFYPGCEEVRYLRNGDPGYPAEPATIDDITASGPDGEIELTDKEMDEAESILMDKVPGACEDDRY